LLVKPAWQNPARFFAFTPPTLDKYLEIGVARPRTVFKFVKFSEIIQQLSSSPDCHVGVMPTKLISP
tara:strand:+ start:727 stop:927 length:201 start_codon:yes stop_codon:yes gene_type:complete